MSTQVQSQSSSLAGQAVIAGVIGGAIVDTFLAITGHRSPIAMWQFIASTVVGQSALTNPNSAVLGFSVHFIVSIVWALLYAYAFNALGQLRNWIAGAIVWGIVVDAGMTAILAVKLGAPYGATFAGGLLGHIVFFMVPVALYLSSTVRRA